MPGKVHGLPPTRRGMTGIAQEPVKSAYGVPPGSAPPSPDRTRPIPDFGAYRVGGRSGDTKTRAATLIAMPEVTSEDLAKYNDAAIKLAHDLAPGESVRWADLVNTAASMAEVEDDEQR